MSSVITLMDRKPEDKEHVKMLCDDVVISCMYQIKRIQHCIRVCICDGAMCNNCMEHMREINDTERRIDDCYKERDSIIAEHYS